MATEYLVMGQTNLFRFFDDIDAIIGTRATSEPPILLDSGIPENFRDSVSDHEDGGKMAKLLS